MSICQKIKDQIDKISKDEVHYNWMIDKIEREKSNFKCPKFNPLNMTNEDMENWSKCGNFHRKKEKLEREKLILNNELWLLEKQKNVFESLGKFLNCHN